MESSRPKIKAEAEKKRQGYLLGRLSDGTLHRKGIELLSSQQGPTISNRINKNTRDNAAVNEVSSTTTTVSNNNNNNNNNSSHRVIAADAVAVTSRSLPQLLNRPCYRPSTTPPARRETAAPALLENTAITTTNNNSVRNLNISRHADSDRFGERDPRRKSSNTYSLYALESKRIKDEEEKNKIKMQEEQQHTTNELLELTALRASWAAQFKTTEALREAVRTCQDDYTKLENELLDEINQLRRDPKGYATVFEAMATMEVGLAPLELKPMEDGTGGNEAGNNNNNNNINAAGGMVGETSILQSTRSIVIGDKEEDRKGKSRRPSGGTKGYGAGARKSKKNDHSGSESKRGSGAVAGFTNSAIHGSSQSNNNNKNALYSETVQLPILIDSQAFVSSIYSANMNLKELRLYVTQLQSFFQRVEQELRCVHELEETTQTMLFEYWTQEDERSQKKSRRPQSSQQAQLDRGNSLAPGINHGGAGGPLNSNTIMTHNTMNVIYKKEREEELTQMKLLFHMRIKELERVLAATKACEEGARRNANYIISCAKSLRECKRFTPKTNGASESSDRNASLSTTTVLSVAHKSALQPFRMCRGLSLAARDVSLTECTNKKVNVTEAIVSSLDRSSECSHVLPSNSDPFEFALPPSHDGSEPLERETQRLRDLSRESCARYGFISGAVRGAQVRDTNISLTTPSSIVSQMILGVSVPFFDIPFSITEIENPASRTTRATRPTRIHYSDLPIEDTNLLENSGDDCAEMPEGLRLLLWPDGRLCGWAWQRVYPENFLASLSGNNGFYLPKAMEMADMESTTPYELHAVLLVASSYEEFTRVKKPENTTLSSIHRLVDEASRAGLGSGLTNIFNEATIDFESHHGVTLIYPTNHPMYITQNEMNHQWPLVCILLQTPESASISVMASLTTSELGSSAKDKGDLIHIDADGNALFPKSILHDPAVLVQRSAMNPRVTVILIDTEHVFSNLGPTDTMFAIHLFERDIGIPDSGYRHMGFIRVQKKVLSPGMRSRSVLSQSKPPLLSGQLTPSLLHNQAMTTSVSAAMEKAETNLFDGTIYLPPSYYPYLSDLNLTCYTGIEEEKRMSPFQLKKRLPHYYESAYVKIGAGWPELHHSFFTRGGVLLCPLQRTICHTSPQLLRLIFPSSTPLRPHSSSERLISNMERLLAREEALFEIEEHGDENTADKMRSTISIILDIEADENLSSEASPVLKGSADFLEAARGKDNSVASITGAASNSSKKRLKGPQTSFFVPNSSSQPSNSSRLPTLKPKGSMRRGLASGVYTSFVVKPENENVELLKAPNIDLTTLETQDLPTLRRLGARLANDLTRMKPVYDDHKEVVRNKLEFLQQDASIKKTKNGKEVSKLQLEQEELEQRRISLDENFKKLEQCTEAVNAEVLRRDRAQRLRSARIQRLRNELAALRGVPGVIERDRISIPSAEFNSSLVKLSLCFAGEEEPHRAQLPDATLTTLQDSYKHDALGGLASNLHQLELISSSEEDGTKMVTYQAVIQAPSNFKGKAILLVDGSEGISWLVDTRVKN